VGEVEEWNFIDGGIVKQLPETESVLGAQAGHTAFSTRCLAVSPLSALGSLARAKDQTVPTIV